MFKRTALAAALLAAASLAQATVTTSTSGLTTTYTENFNGGSSFSAGFFDDPLSADDFMYLGQGLLLPTSSSFTFSSAAAIASLSFNFWFSGPLNGTNGTVTLRQVAPSNTIGFGNLGNTPGNAAQFLLNNPGAGTGGLGGTFDRPFTSPTFSNLAAGSYQIVFGVANTFGAQLRVDDFQMQVTAVPEPATVALMLAGLGVVGAAAKRRRAATAKGDGKGEPQPLAA
jgi:hypothetical protein